MKSKHTFQLSTFIFQLSLLLLLLPTASCSFLDVEPFDNFTDEEFWKSEDQARSYMYGFYTSVFSGYGTTYASASSVIKPGTNDDVCEQDQQPLQPTVVPVSSGSWSFANVRKANYVIHNVDRLPIDSASINHWRGVARFFRACYYSSLVFTFGDVPWFDTLCVVSDKKADMDYMYKDRDPRTFVDARIIEDFDYAMKYVRQSDGSLQINRYVVAAMASRYLLREGTYLKYVKGESDMSATCLQKAKEAAEMVMTSNKYSIAPSYGSLFYSEDLGGNPEVIMHRHYASGVNAHQMLSINFAETQEGCSKSLAEAFVCSDGLPVYVKDIYWTPRTEAEFFANRDPRLTMCIRPKYYIKGMDCKPFAYALTGFSWRKYMDDSRANTPDPTWTGLKNTTDAPCIRYAEVLLNYAEAAYELSTMGKGTFTQADLDKSINLIRARADVNLPALKISGEQMMVNNVAFDDPMRMTIESYTGETPVTPILWEIRRERRCELCMEGFRVNDLKRWKRLDYVWNGCNPDIRYGAYIVLANYPGRDPEIVLEDETATEGYILRNTAGQRPRPVAHDYIAPIRPDKSPSTSPKVTTSLKTPNGNNPPIRPIGLIRLIRLI